MCASSQHAFARPNHDATAPTPSHKKNTINRYSQPPCPKEGQTVYDCQTVTGNSLRVLRNDMLQVNRAGGYFAVGGGGAGRRPAPAAAAAPRRNIINDPLFQQMTPTQINRGSKKLRTT